MSTLPQSNHTIDAIAALFSTLLNITLVQVLGYAMKRSQRLSQTALAGIGAFAGTVALPALLLRAVAALDFGQVDLSVCCSLLAGKLCLVGASLAVSILTTLSTAQAGSLELRAGVLGLLMTNSDDLGLGLPVLGAIFPPQLVGMCFVLNSIQLMLLNPLLFVLLGVGKARHVPEGRTPLPTGEVVLHVLHSLTKNVVLLSVAAGLVYNLAIGGGTGASLPPSLDSLCRLLGQAFSPIVLFLSGASNVGAFTVLSHRHHRPQSRP